MTILKNLSMATTGAIFIALGTVGSAQAITLGFEGIGDVKPIGSFYNTEPQDFDIVFSPNALALIDKDAGGTGNIANEPSPNTALFFLQGSASTLNALNGFNMGFSFYYSASYFPGSIKVYDGLNATGNVLATLDLPKHAILVLETPKVALETFWGSTVHLYRLVCNLQVLLNPLISAVLPIKLSLTM